jgi:hypothetical protein
MWFVWHDGQHHADGLSTHRVAQATAIGTWHWVDLLCCLAPRSGDLPVVVARCALGSVLALCVAHHHQPQPAPAWAEIGFHHIKLRASVSTILNGHTTPEQMAECFHLVSDACWTPAAAALCVHVACCRWCRRPCKAAGPGAPPDALGVQACTINRLCSLAMKAQWLYALISRSWLHERSGRGALTTNPQALNSAPRGGLTCLNS